jgi:hypothetical protein
MLKSRLSTATTTKFIIPKSMNDATSDKRTTAITTKFIIPKYHTNLELPPTITNIKRSPIAVNHFKIISLRL